MLMPMGDVPRWFAERKPKDAVAVSHGADLLTWEAPFILVDPSWN
jgi:bile acid-coenzyme A ligase